MAIDFLTLKQWYRDSLNHLADWRKEAREAYDFKAGRQWAPEDQAILKEQGRPEITFNRIDPQIDAVTGMEVNNRQETAYFPREIGDAQRNEVITAAGEYLRDGCGAADEESHAFEDAIVAGIGATETRLDYDANPEGDLIVDRIDVLDELLWDAHARKRNISDARYIIRVKKIERSDAEAMFPDHELTDIHAAWAESFKDKSDTPHDADNAKYYKENQGGKESYIPAKITVVEAQWWEKAAYYLVLDPFNGEKKELSASEFKTVSKRLKDMTGESLEHVKMKKKVYKRAWVGAKEILELEDSPCPFSFSYKFITGKFDRNKGYWYGLIRGMTDPQRWANSWLAQAMHIINTNAKGGLLAEKDAFENPRKAQEEWSSPDAITWVKQGALQSGKIKEKGQAAFPASIAQLMEFAVSSIPQVSGINLDAIGLADRNQPGVLENMRRQAVMTILATLFGNLRRYRKEQGRVTLYYITEHLSDGRLVRLMGDNGAKYVPLVKEEGVGEYDVVVDENPTSPNQKDKVWLALTQLMPLLSKLELPPTIWMELLKYSPLPASLTEKVAGIMQEEMAKAQQGPPPDPKMLEVQRKAEEGKARLQIDAEAHRAEMQQALVEIAKIKSEIIKNLAQAEAAELGPQMQEYERQMNLLEQGIQHQMDLEKAQVQQQGELAKQQAQAQQQPQTLQ